MKMSIRYDLASYLQQIFSDISKAEKLAVKRNLKWVIELAFHNEREKLQLPLVVQESCALANLSHHFQELAKNSMDALIAKWLASGKTGNTMVEIDIEIEYSDDEVTVSYYDNGTGFPDIAAGQLVLFQNTRYAQKQSSSKFNVDHYLGGASKGLRLFYYNMQQAGHDLLLGTRADGQGAQIAFSSSLEPYMLPTCHNEQLQADAFETVQLELPAKLRIQNKAEQSKPVVKANAMMFFHDANEASAAQKRPPQEEENNEQHQEPAVANMAC